MSRKIPGSIPGNSTINGSTLADLVELQTHKSKVQFPTGLPFCKQDKRAGAIPLGASVQRCISPMDQLHG